MPPIKHALLGASSAKRWMHCTPAARWEATLPEPPERDFTVEGTLAHALCEAKLGKPEELAAQREILKGSPLYNEAMEKYTDVYVEYINDLMDTLTFAMKEPRLYLETRVDYSKWAPEGFGTSDCIILSDKVMYIIDFKYGKGVPVSAEDNPQLKLYAAGAWEAFRRTDDIDIVVMVIVQPRLDNISESRISVKDLLDWMDNEVVPAAKLAYAGEGDFNPSTETCRFCKGRNLCRYYAAYNLKVGNLSDKTGPEMTMLEIGGLLEDLDGLIRWAKGLKEFAEEQAVSGTDVPGWKLVEGRSNRNIRDKDTAAATLLNEGYVASEIMSLNGITDLEKVVGKKKLSELLGDLIVKPEGSPTLVKETDKRPALDRRAKESDYFKGDN